jgi:lipopolysaccharide transport system permease protein
MDELHKAINTPPLLGGSHGCAQGTAQEYSVGGRRGSTPHLTQKPTPNIPLVRQIRPTSSWSWLDLSELWSYRDLLWSLAFRDLRLRYRQTALGVLWVVFQPLAGAGIFTLVFGWVAGMRAPEKSYFLFSLAGLLTWNAFQSTLGKSSMALLGNASLVSKVYFPRLLLPFSTILSTLVDLSIGLCAFLVIGWFSNVRPQWEGLCALLLWVGFALASSLGLGLLAASVMTRFRDVQHVLPMLLPFLMYASPVAYGMASVPQGWEHFFKWNPVGWMLEGTRAALIGGESVPLSWVAYTAAVSAVLLVAGVVCFRRMERSFADVV